MRSRTPSVVRSLDPRSLNASAAPASRTNWRVGTRPAERGRRGQDERRRAGDQRAVEVEERRARAGADHLAVLAHGVVPASLDRRPRRGGRRSRLASSRAEASGRGSSATVVVVAPGRLGHREVVRHTAGHAEPARPRPPRRHARDAPAASSARSAVADLVVVRRRVVAAGRRRRRGRTRHAARRGRRRRACRARRSRRASSAPAPRSTGRSAPSALGEVGERAHDPVRRLVQRRSCAARRPARPSRSRRARPDRGRNPSNTNRPVGSPLVTRAATSAVGPGTVVTS